MAGPQNLRSLRTDEVQRTSEDSDTKPDREQKDFPAPPVLHDLPISEGDYVWVEHRTWPGMNKHGGYAWVKKVHEDGSCDVHYPVERRREKNIPRQFIRHSSIDLNGASPVEDVGGQKRSGAGTTSSKSGRASRAARRSRNINYQEVESQDHWSLMRSRPDTLPAPSVCSPTRSTPNNRSSSPRTEPSIAEAKRKELPCLSYGVDISGTITETMETNAGNSDGGKMQGFLGSKEQPFLSNDGSGVSQPLVPGNLKDDGKAEDSPRNEDQTVQPESRCQESHQDKLMRRLTQEFEETSIHSKPLTQEILKDSENQTLISEPVLVDSNGIEDNSSKGQDTEKDSVLKGLAITEPNPSLKYVRRNVADAWTEKTYGGKGASYKCTSKTISNHSSGLQNIDIEGLAAKIQRNPTVPENESSQPDAITEECTELSFPANKGVSHFVTAIEADQEGGTCPLSTQTETFDTNFDAEAMELGFGQSNALRSPQNSSDTNSKKAPAQQQSVESPVKSLPCKNTPKEGKTGGSVAHVDTLGKKDSESIACPAKRKAPARRKRLGSPINSPRANRGEKAPEGQGAQSNDDGKLKGSTPSVQTQVPSQKKKQTTIDEVFNFWSQEKDPPPQKQGILRQTPIKITMPRIASPTKLTEHHQEQRKHQEVADSSNEEVKSEGSNVSDTLSVDKSSETLLDSRHGSSTITDSSKTLHSATASEMRSSTFGQTQDDFEKTTKETSSISELNSPSSSIPFEICNSSCVVNSPETIKPSDDSQSAVVENGPNENLDSPSLIAAASIMNSLKSNCASHENVLPDSSYLINKTLSNFHSTSPLSKTKTDKRESLQERSCAKDNEYTSQQSRELVRTKHATIEQCPSVRNEDEKDNTTHSDSTRQKVDKSKDSLPLDFEVNGKIQDTVSKGADSYTQIAQDHPEILPGRDQHKSSKKTNCFEKHMPVSMDDQINTVLQADKVNIPVLDIECSKASGDSGGIETSRKKEVGVNNGLCKGKGTSSHTGSSEDHLAKESETKSTSGDNCSNLEKSLIQEHNPTASSDNDTGEEALANKNLKESEFNGNVEGDVAEIQSDANNIDKGNEDIGEEQHTISDSDSDTEEKAAPVGRLSEPLPASAEPKKSDSKRFLLERSKTVPVLPTDCLKHLHTPCVVVPQKQLQVADTTTRSIKLKATPAASASEEPEEQCLDTFKSPPPSPPCSLVKSKRQKTGQEKSMGALEPCPRGKRKSPDTHSRTCQKENEHPNSTLGMDKSGSRSMEELVEAAMKQRFPRFKVNDVVEVAARVGPGINKHGGIARVTHVHPDGFYDVKYIVTTGKEIRIESRYVDAPEHNLMGEEAESNKRSKRSRVRFPAHQVFDVASTKGSRAGNRGIKRTKPLKRKEKPLVQKMGHQNIEVSNKKPVFVATGVPEIIIKRLEKLALITGGKVANEFTEDVTHVVTSTLKGSRMAAKRTLKYLHGVLQGKWIVSSEWVSGCLVAGRILNEEQFEVTGDPKAKIPDAPRRARFSRHRSLTVGLFKDFAFYFHGNFMPPKPSRDHLQLLILAGKGQVVDKFDQLVANHPVNSRRIVVCNCYLAFPEIFEMQKEMSEEIDYEVVDSDWILGSVSNYRILKFETVV